MPLTYYRLLVLHRDSVGPVKDTQQNMRVLKILTNRLRL